MKAITFLSLATTVAYAAETQRPTTFGLDVMFAGKNATKAVSGDPIVFSLHNMEQDLKFGYSFNWEISNDKKKYNGSVTVASLTTEKEDKFRNYWYASDSVPDSDDLSVGNYSFSWEWKMLGSRQPDRIITYDIEEKVTSGSIDFTVSDPEEKKKKNKDRPVFEATFSQASSNAGGEASTDLKACVSAGKGTPTCGKVDRSEKKVDPPSSNTKDGDNEGPGSAGTRVAASQFGTLALVVAIGGALLL